MTMKFKFGTIWICLLLLVACGGKSAYGDVDPEFEIDRFDKALFEYLEKGESDDQLDDYIPFLHVLGERVIKIGTPDSSDFYTYLKDYFSEPALMELYRSEQDVFADIEAINRELSYGMNRFFAEFPEVPKPRIYMHVSGWMQNVIVTDEILSLSVDKYLGADFPAYAYFFEDYKRQLMSPDRVVPDYLTGFMLANVPFVGDQTVLLDRMIYEGKLCYALSQFIPEREVWEFVGYNREQYDWCKDNESRIWKTILENKHLYTPDWVTTDKYIREAPYTALLPVESPGRTGVWLGFRIITSYMKNNPGTTLKELINLTDYQQILKDSKYKP